MAVMDVLDGELTGDLADDVAAVRGFSRFYTRVVGALDEGLLDTPYSLTEARLLFELAQQEQTEVVDLRRAMGVDGGYLSRLLSRFEADGLLTRSRSTADARRQIIRLTDAGQAAFRLVNARSAEQVGELLAGVDPADRRRLVGAMATIEDVLGEVAGPRAVVIRPAGPGDYGWVVHKHGWLYALEYDWDETFEALVARIVADFIDDQRADPKRLAAWIAEVDGQPVGCVFCCQKDPETAQLRLLLVEPSARGLGIGGRLIDECLRFARRAGYRRMTLWTNDVLVDARRLYDRAGFTLTAEDPHHSFGHPLIGQTFDRDL